MKGKANYLALHLLLNEMKKDKFLYLLTNQDTFKVGYSIDPTRRLKEYKTHNPHAKIEGIFRVESKSMEWIVQTELKKRGYKTCQQPEWFYGNLHYKELESILDVLETKRKFCKINY